MEFVPEMYITTLSNLLAFQVVTIVIVIINIVISTT